ncbi:MAG: hypothetical protein DRH20_13000, partial [Deltaproteobacteria bacterium]
MFEPLENRILLSGDTVAVLGTPGDDTLILEAAAVTVDPGPPQTFAAEDDLTVQGLEGDDRFAVSGIPESASTEVDGGQGADTLDFSALDSPLTFSFTPTTVTVSDDSADAKSLRGLNIETLIGGSGADTLDFSGNEDPFVFVIRKDGTVTVTDGDYTINADGTITVAGGTGSIEANGIENLIGGDGINTFVFEDGAALEGTITGGSGGGNTLDYSAWTEGVHVDLSSGAAQGTAGVSNIQNVTGGAGDDILIGDGNANVIDGGKGADILAGGGGSDSLYVSDLEQTSGSSVRGGGENDLLDLSDEDSDLTISLASLTELTVSDDAAVPNTLTANGVETVFAGAGTDTLDLSAVPFDLTFILHNYGGVTITDGDYTVNPDGTLSLMGGTGAVTVLYVENIVGGQGANTFAFEDRAYLAGTIDGGSDAENTLDYTAFTKGLQVDLGMGTATGTSGIINIHRVLGGAGDDVIAGSAGDDILDGGPGVDTIDYSAAAGGVAVDLGVETPQDTGSAGLDTLLHFENVTGSPFADILTGDQGPNVINGGAGNDTLRGGEGDDVYALGQGGGTDTIFENPGEGSDTLDLSLMTSGTVFTIHADGTISATTGPESIHNAPNLENIVGGSGQDTFTFDDGATLSGAIDGGAGSSNTLDYSRYTSGVSVDLSTGKAQGTGGVSHIDHLIGGSASDVLTGDDKANVIAGGPGDDIINGGGGADTVDYGSAPGAVNVNLSSQSATGGGGADTVRNVENIVGSPFDDTLTGDGNANVIRGGPGDDIIDGGGGADTVDYGGAPGAVTVNLATMSATGAAGSDIVRGMENIIGSPFDDTLTGDGNANVIQGGPGDDALAGGPGDDTYLLVGHWGFDTVFEAAGGGGDSLVVEGSPDNDIFSVGTGIVERKDPATLAVTDNVAYGDGIESLRVDGGSGPADRIVLGGSLSLDQSVSFSADEITIAQDIFAAGGITATAEEALTVEAGVTLSTRRVSGLDHENGISTGDSGDITLKAPYTQLLSGSKLLAHVEAGGGYSPGKITLSARAGSDATGDLLRVEDIGSRVTLSDAIIKGGTVTIGADTDTDTAFGDIEDLGDTASFTLEAIGQFSVIGGWSVSKALSEVDIGPGTHIEAVDAEIRAGAKTTAKIMTIFTALGVSYGESNPRARVLVRDGASITTTGDMDIH